MCFQFVETTWNNLELYTPPYFKNKKVSQEIMLRISRETGWKQVFEVIRCFINSSSEELFQKYQDS